MQSGGKEGTDGCDCWVVEGKVEDVQSFGGWQPEVKGRVARNVIEDLVCRQECANGCTDGRGCRVVRVTVEPVQFRSAWVREVGGRLALNVLLCGRGFMKNENTCLQLPCTCHGGLPCHRL